MVALAGVIILGIVAQWLAWRTRVPAILPLILIGLLVGPISTLFTANGEKLIEPIYRPETGEGLFPPNLELFYFVSLAIGIILFEGGLTLKVKEIKGVGQTILKLVTIGSLITFIGGGIAAHFIMDLNWSISFLFSGLIIVTGPTVIAPILRNVPLTRNVATVLKWEGILIDPIGAMVAVLVFNFILSGDVSHGHNQTQEVIISFFRIVLIGLALGAVSAYALYQLIKSSLVPEYLLNIFTLAWVLGIFVISDIIAHESGLLTVVVMGLVMGNLDVPRLKEILSFKESISVLLISVLFILLSANMDIGHLELLLNWQCLLLFVVVVFVLRPLGVFASTRGGELLDREKLFISWVGPRGIVAAGIASVFGLKLIGEIEGAEYITPLVFMIVLGTVVLNATTARLVARLLNVTQSASNGVLIIGGHKASRIIGKYLTDKGRHVIIIDNNKKHVSSARKLGIESFQANIYTDDLKDQFELLDMGYLLALTGNPEVNSFAIKRFRDDFGENGSYRLLSPEEMAQDKMDLPEEGLFSYYDDYLNINEAARDYPNIYELEMNNVEELKLALARMKQHPRCIPLFYKNKEDRLEIIPKDLDNIPDEEGIHLVYMGKKIGESEEE